MHTYWLNNTLLLSYIFFHFSITACLWISHSQLYFTNEETGSEFKAAHSESHRFYNFSVSCLFVSHVTFPFWHFSSIMKQVHFIDIVKKDIRPLHQEGLDEAENPNSRKLIKIERLISLSCKRSLDIGRFGALRLEEFKFLLFFWFIMYNFIHEVISWSRIAARAPDSPCIYQPTRNTRLSFCRHFPGTVRTTFAHFPLARICNMVTAWGWGDFYSGQPYAQLKKKKKADSIFKR